MVAIIGARAVADEPIATLAVISNPYITTLPANEIKDERGSVRGFLAKTAPDAMSKAVDLMNRVEGELGINFPMGNVLSGPTIETLAESLIGTLSSSASGEDSDADAVESQVEAKLEKRA